MNNYEDRTMSHKRVRMDAEGGAGVVQGNGLPLNYMDNGHQVGYGAPPGAYGGGGGYYAGGGGAGAAGGGDWGEYGAARGLAYAPPAHQPYQQPPPQAAAAAAAFLQHQQHLQMQYEQQRHHLQHAQHLPQAHHKWPQSIMQPLQATTEPKMKSEVKTEPSVVTEPLNIPQPLPLTTITSSATMLSSADPSGMLGGQGIEDPPKIKIKTDIFKDETSSGHSPASNPSPAPINVVSNTKPSTPVELDIVREKPVDNGPERATSMASKPDSVNEVEKAQPSVNPSSVEQPSSDTSRITTDPGNPATVIDPTSGENVPVETNITKTDTETTATPTVAMPSPSPPPSSDEESVVPNDVYFGTPDAYRAGGSIGATSTTSSTTGEGDTTPTIISTAMMHEGKKRGRPKGSTNKPKPPEFLAAKAQVGVVGVARGQVGRPRGGGSQYLGMRPFKRDFSGIRFRRRWSDDCLDSSHIPNEVFFGDVPVSMEILYNYYDANVEREKMQAQQQAAKAAAAISGTPVSQGQANNNVTLVYSSSDSSSDDSSDSDSSDEGDGDNNQQQMMQRGRGRPRGSKTINRRTDGPRTPGSVHSGDKGPGITEMKRFIKAAGIEYDYAKLVDGCNSNKERVVKLSELLREKGLQGEPTLEACRALYTGPPKGRRGPQAGIKRGPRKSKSSDHSDSDGSEKEEVKKPAKKSKPSKPVKEPKVKPVKPPKTPKTPANTEEGSRRLTRGQTSGKPRQKIIISSDEEDTPISKLRVKK